MIQLPPPGRIVRGRWWALVRSPKALPVIFGSKADAMTNADPDEQLVHVEVRQVPKPQRKKR